ncbi:putative short-chain dehydrogenase/reductase family 42E member 2 isoform X2 [Betta splendens]|uniref:Short-chain dehydrogenase/reductase family 42E member 2 isoform X2 n=1 Tax=Betta splendens TaxID=158456 RepID=A0A9W2XZ11_BETSP|nr:putative short-chain dehydrogenase/reductase family 42E member 2 isoform X2 [Betta splendens]
MELCSPNMSESGGSLCQVKQLPCPSIALCRLQASGHHTHSLPLLAPPWLNHAAPRPRAAGPPAGGAAVECAAARLGREAAVAWGDSRGRVVVTGGGGYFGFRLGKELASRGMSVILLDLHPPPCDIPEGVTFYQSDICDYSSMYKVCDGVDCVFHTASCGMSGPEQLRKEHVESVNIGGTHNVIKLCKERSIPRLVYTSTINVVFNGKPIEDGDEASVSPVRPDTVNVERRLFSFRFGNPQSRMNWVHVDNLVLAHTLAAEALTGKRSCVASGQVYFINDGVSVNLFEWLTPLFNKLGCRRPLINLPVSLVYSAAIVVENLHLALRPLINVPLLFTRNEVRTIAVNHTFKIDKARKELGYCPKTYSLVDSVEQYLESREPRPGSCPFNTPWTSKLLRHIVQLLLMILSSFLLMLFCIVCHT